jgi:hypothetical protein
MDRREAVKYISILLGASVVGADAMLLGCKSDTGRPREFTPDNIAFLNEVGETILPATSTPGAKAANVGEFMKVMVNDTYEEVDQTAFFEGIQKLDAASKKKFDNDFMKISPAQRQELLIEIDKESKDYQKTKVDVFNNTEKEKKNKDNNYKKQRIAPHYFMMMKQLTLLGFFTSEAGSKSVRYVPVPGKFEGCIDYKKGDKLMV